MKATKLLGSVALTAALAMGTVPAFASVNAPSDWENGTDQGIGGAGVSVNKKMITNLTTDSNNHKTGTGSTAVKASVFDADMQVTIPLQLSVAFASIGSELTCPSDGAYNIINNGDKPVNITHINATGSGFTLGDYDTTKSDLAAAGNGSATRTIAMLLDCGTDKVVDLKKAVDKGGALADVDTYGKNGTRINDIPIPAKTPLAIKLSGTTNKFNTALAVGYQMATIMTITYTVETA